MPLDEIAPTTSPAPVELVFAADSGYAMPLAVAARSALERLRPGRSLRVTVLDGGLDEQAKQRLAESWDHPNCAGIEWRKIDDRQVSDLVISGHVNRTTYYRMLLPRVLPPSFRRVLYLDGDILVRSDISRLWETDLGAAPCAAVQDCAVPYLDAALALPNFRECGPYLVARRPIPNVTDLGLDGRLPYFNAGVLLVDVEAWRQSDASEQLIGCLQEHRKFVRWWDQYALNVVFAGQWKPLDLRWNQGAHLYCYPDWQRSPLDQPTFQTLRDAPAIVHFSSAVKPWHAESRHPFREEFYEVLDRTSWRGWRPRSPFIRKFSRKAYWRVREQARLAWRRAQLALGVEFVR